jgi:hypothetical protein
VKPVGEPDAGDRHVRFDERGWETECCRMAQATAPILDSTRMRRAAMSALAPMLGDERTYRDIAQPTRLTPSRHVATAVHHVVALREAAAVNFQSCDCERNNKIGAAYAASHRTALIKAQNQRP